MNDSLTLMHDTLVGLGNLPDDRGSGKGMVSLLLTNGHTLVGYPEIVGEADTVNLSRKDHAWLIPLAHVVAVGWSA